MRYIVFFFILLLSETVSGQQKGSISGKVMDNNSGKPLAFATVVLKAKEQNVLAGKITNEKGTFQFNDIAAGDYLLEIEFIGFERLQTLVQLKTGQSFKLPTINLLESAELLDGVTIVSKKSTIEQRLDRKIVNVGKDLISLGPSAIDLMNNLPSVNINSDGNISFRGSDNVRILINGKLSNLENPADVLQQIPSNSIKKIELISNPSAKYNPDGLNGIINIILKKSAREGWNTSLSTNVIIAQRERYNSNASFNFKPKNNNYYLEYNNSYGDQITDGTVNRFDLNSSQFTKNINNRKSNVIKFGTDLYLSESSTLSILTNQNFYNASFDGAKSVIFEYNPEDNFILNDLLVRDNHTQTYNTDYKWLIDKEEHLLEFETDYNRFESDIFNDFDFIGSTLVPSYEETIRDIRSVFTLNLDYKVPLTQKTTLETGFESRINRIKNNYNATFEELQKATFQYDRDIFSSYLIYSGKAGKFEFNLGSRFEYYIVDAQFEQEKNEISFFDQTLFNIFPSLFVSYQASETSPNQYQLSYGRRIERPSFNQVNPLRQVTTPQIIATGNLELFPQISNSVELNYLYSFNKGWMNLGLFYRKVQDEINRIGIFDQEDPNLLRLSYENFDSNDAYGIELGVNFTFSNWWKTNLNLEFYSREQRGLIENETIAVQNSLTNIKWTHNFNISKNISASLFGFYIGPQEILQYELKPNYYLNAGLRFNFDKGKGNININANDILGTQRFAFRTYRTVFQEGEFLRDTQQIFLGLSYRLGGKLLSPSRKRRKNNIKADRFL